MMKKMIEYVVKEEPCDGGVRVSVAVHDKAYETHDMKPTDFCSRGERKDGE